MFKRIGSTTFARAATPDGTMDKPSLLGSLMDRFERGRANRDIKRMKAHLAWTEEQRASVTSNRDGKRR